MTDTAAENPLLQASQISSAQLPVPSFTSITNRQGVQNQADVIISQAGAQRETQEAGVASAALERALAALAQRRQELQAAQADRAAAESDAAAAQRELAQAQTNLSSAQSALSAAQEAAARAKREEEEAARRRIQPVQQSQPTPQQAPQPMAPQKDWANDQEFKELSVYAATDYNPRMWRAEEEALREINWQMQARGNRMNDTSGVDVAKIRRDIGQRYNVTIDGSNYTDPRMLRYMELQRQAGNTYIPVDQSEVLAAYNVWKQKTGGDWRDRWDQSKQPPSAGVGRFVVPPSAGVGKF